MKRSFFQAADRYCYMDALHANKTAGEETRSTQECCVQSSTSWQQHPTRHQLYGHLPPITKSIQVRRTHAGHCWRSSYVLLWIPHTRPRKSRTTSTNEFVKKGRYGDRWQLHKNAACNPQQVLAATPHKTPTVRPPAPITKSIQVRRTRHAGHCWRSRDELIRDVLLWIPTHGRAKAGRPARTYIQQLVAREGQGYPCCQHDMMMMMMMMMMIFNFIDQFYSFF